MVVFNGPRWVLTEGLASPLDGEFAAWILSGARRSGIRAIVADGHCATRLGVWHILRLADIRVVAETGDVEEALRLVGNLRPNLVILGLNLDGEADGMGVLRSLKALPQPPRVLVYSVYNFSNDVVSCFLSGAEGFVHKSASREDLLEAVRRVALGERVRVLERNGDYQRYRVRDTPSGECLTDRESEVAMLIVRGFSNTEIADRLYLSLPTVKSHVKSILRKSGARNRRELVQVREERAAYETDDWKQVRESKESSVGG